MKRVKRRQSQEEKLRIGEDIVNHKEITVMTFILLKYRIIVGPTIKKEETNVMNQLTIKTAAESFSSYRANHVT